MPKVKLSQGEINDLGSDIYKILCNVPSFYLHEILELALDGRVKDGDDPDLDISDSESEEECEPETEEEEEEEEEDDG